jgi:type IX secretion system PorP/SprF family membrane protein
MRFISAKHLKTLAKSLLILMVSSASIISPGQQVPNYPVSHRIFSYHITNPAVAGSKDFTTIDLNTAKHGDLKSQILSFHGRLAKPGNRYFSMAEIPEFTNIGVGGTIFNEVNEISRIVGIGGSGSYHLKIDKSALSFISIGASAKFLFNNYRGDPDLNRPTRNSFTPNIDLGIYYYSPMIFAGISATNILGKPAEPDTLGYNTFPLTPYYLLNGGTRIVLNRSHGIVIEPSLSVITDNEFSQKVMDMLKPAIKLYIGKFSLGTYLNNYDNVSFFFQFKYPKIHIGTYLEFQRNSPFYKTPPITEFVLGINLSTLKSGVSRPNHW